MARVSSFLLVSVVCWCIFSGVISQFRMSRYRRYRGPNVCAAEEVMGTRKRYYSECMPRLPRTICGKKTFIRHHCCTGFEKVDGDEEGCRGVVPMRDIMTTAKNMHMMDFIKYVQRSGLENKFQEPGPYTMFIPHRIAFHQLDKETKELLSTPNEDENLIRMHAVEGRYYKKDLLDGMELPSIYYYEDEGMLKINKYNNGIRTVNCVRIIKMDHVATNGIIHITEKVINPYPNGGTIMDILLRDESFGELVTALIVSDLSNELRDGNGEYTIFAPTDNAFRNAPQEIINRILSDKELVKKLLRYHQMEKALCSAAVLGKTRVRSREGQMLNLTCDINDQIRVNDIPVKEADIVASNGVIHVIDELLIPDSVKSIGDIIDEMNLLKFIEYAQQAGLQKILSGEAPGNYTVFVPRPEAFDDLNEYQMLKLQTDSQFVKETFRYHMVPELVTTHDMNDGQALDTLAQTPLRVNIYQKKHGVNSAMIVDADHVVGHGVIHVIDKVLFPPALSAMEIIKQDPRLSTFNSLLRSSGLDRQLDRPGHYTIFAPTRRAFDQLPRSFMERITRDQELLKKTIGYHVLDKPVFTSGLRHNLQYRQNTLANAWIRLKIKNEETPLMINNRVSVVEEDIESTTGVIHIVDEILQCPCVEDFRRL